MKRRVECKRKPRACPLCASGRVATILYGMPAYSEKLEQDLATGRIALGGCCVDEDDAVWRCLDCDAAIHRGELNRVWPEVVEDATADREDSTADREVSTGDRKDSSADDEDRPSAGD